MILFATLLQMSKRKDDTLGFDVLEIVSMDSAASDKLLENIRAIQQNQPEDLDLSNG